MDKKKATQYFQSLIKIKQSFSEHLKNNKDIYSDTPQMYSIYQRLNNLKSEILQVETQAYQVFQSIHQQPYISPKPTKIDKHSLQDSLHRMDSSSQKKSENNLNNFINKSPLRGNLPFKPLQSNSSFKKQAHQQIDLNSQGKISNDSNKENISSYNQQNHYSNNNINNSVNTTLNFNVNTISDTMSAKPRIIIKPQQQYNFKQPQYPIQQQFKQNSCTFNTNPPLNQFQQQQKQQQQQRGKQQFKKEFLNLLQNNSQVFDRLQQSAQYQQKCTFDNSLNNISSIDNTKLDQDSTLNQSHTQNLIYNSVQSLQQNSNEAVLGSFLDEEEEEEEEEQQHQQQSYSNSLDDDCGGNLEQLDQSTLKKLKQEYDINDSQEFYNHESPLKSCSDSSYQLSPVKKSQLIKNQTKKQQKLTNNSNQPQPKINGGKKKPQLPKQTNKKINPEKNQISIIIKKEEDNTPINPFQKKLQLSSRSASKNFDKYLAQIKQEADIDSSKKDQIIEEDYNKENNNSSSNNSSLDNSIHNSSSCIENSFSSSGYMDEEGVKQKKKYQILDLQERKQALKFYNQTQSYVKVSEKFGISKKTIRRWVKDGIEKKKGGGRRPLDPEMEINLKNWIVEYYKNNEKKLSKKLIRQKAYDLSNYKDSFKCSKGWFDKFVSRYNIPEEIQKAKNQQQKKTKRKPAHERYFKRNPKIQQLEDEEFVYYDD